MKNFIANLLKAFILFAIGGFVYLGIEILYRGYTHWSMYILGGICFVLMGLINEVFTFEMSLVKQMFLSSIIITSLEFICGVIVNLILGWNVWDYTNLPFNIMGQVSLLFFFLWFLLSLVGIIIDDYLRYFFFNEEKPHYQLFSTKKCNKRV